MLKLFKLLPVQWSNGKTSWVVGGSTEEIGVQVPTGQFFLFSISLEVQDST